MSHASYRRCLIYLQSSEVQVIRRLIEEEEIVRDQDEGGKSHTGLFSSCVTQRRVKIKYIYYLCAEDSQKY